LSEVSDAWSDGELRLASELASSVWSLSLSMVCEPFAFAALSSPSAAFAGPAVTTVEMAGGS
jgi:hypothetical protein